MIMPHSHDDRIAVIGAGLGGLAAACTLAARGHRVVLFDRNPWMGGKAAQLNEQGFRFDMGPTILTLPVVLERIFKEAGRDLGDYLDLVRLDPQWRCFFDDGSVLDLHQQIDRMADYLTAQGGPAVGDGYRRFMKLAERLDDISERFFFWKSIESVFDMMDPRTAFDIKTLSDVMAMRMGRSVAGTIRSFVPEQRVAQMLDHYVQYVGSSPYGSPAVLCGIASMQAHGGVWYPMGGTRAVPEALLKLAGELGVELRPGCGIDHIETTRAGVQAVITADGERVPVRAAVSNMDAIRTYRELLDAPLARKINRKRNEPACSGVVLYLGLKERYEHLLHHGFVFSRDPHEEFDAIYHKGEPAPDPTAYLCAPSFTEPGVAPTFDGKQGEALYVLVHTPYLRPHHDWSTMFPAYREVILDKLECTAGLTGLRDRIVIERRLTPQDIHNRYHVLNGAIYGLASHGKFWGAFKPGNRRADVPGLYLAGGAAHPGPGMPMVMMSGWIAADSLDQDLPAAGGRADIDSIRQTADLATP